LKKFSRWTSEADLHNQLNRLVSDVETRFAQIPPPTVTSPSPTPTPATSGGGIGAASSGGAGVSAGPGIAATAGAGGTTVSNAGVITIVGQGVSTVAGAAVVNQQAQRVTTGAIPLSSTVQVTLTWTVPFLDALYTPVVSVVDSSGFLAVVDIASFSATAVIVNIINNDASNPHTGTLCVMALHD
jgi:hypothetical protein